MKVKIMKIFQSSLDTRNIHTLMQETSLPLRSLIHLLSHHGTHISDTLRSEHFDNLDDMRIGNTSHNLPYFVYNMLLKKTQLSSFTHCDQLRFKNVYPCIPKNTDNIRAILINWAVFTLNTCCNRLHNTWSYHLTSILCFRTNTYKIYIYIKPPTNQPIRGM